ncbi:AAA family ATPase [Candidatus Albibeggiatoa sp. nov. BB20]|uniref:AAA family ATPase n=1 Tax=Candidatus Albibeggiatoa sp. nov. BB20 TaxID=3162723 RepID=UPI0033658A84
MKFPYGLADFEALISEGYYYADRTQYIHILEESSKHLLFLRPRRFGKSLLLGMLENYYDSRKADKFNKLFGHLKIGDNPTPTHNQYFVMRWDFSMVDGQGTIEEIKRALHNQINASIWGMSLRYPNIFDKLIIDKEDSLSSLRSLVEIINQTSHKLYLLIDEYDNFANEVMIAQPSDYPALVRGEGIIKTLFKVIKGLSAGQGIDRVFITGVSPVVMSDVSSGYNVAKNISLRPEYADLCGFHEQEIIQVLKQIAQKCELSTEKTDEALDMMRTFYNGYRFDKKGTEKIYNPTLVLYFFDILIRDCAYPEQLLDSNLAMDRNRINYIAKLPHGQDIIARILDPENPAKIGELADKFGVEDMLFASKDQPFMGSLLYYLGVVTLGERDQFGELSLQVPNLVIRRLYIERIKEMLLPEYEDKEAIRSVAKAFYHHGNLQPLCDFIENRYFQVFDNRDYKWSNELVIKSAFLTILFSDTFYIMDSEQELNKGYADLSLIVRPDMRQYQLLDHVLEFKYLKLSDLNMTGKQVKAQSREALAQLPMVQKALAEAEQQLNHYRQALIERHRVTLRLHTYAVIALGFERLVFVEV